MSRSPWTIHKVLPSILRAPVGSVIEGIQPVWIHLLGPRVVQARRIIRVGCTVEASLRARWLRSRRFGRGTASSNAISLCVIEMDRKVLQSCKSCISSLMIDIIM
jgi:hypothetical protein